MKPKLVGVKASKLVILALHDIEASSVNDDEGATLEEITKFISKKYNIDFNETKGSVNAVLGRGVTFGIFKEKNGRFKLEDVPEPPLRLPDSKSEKLATIIAESRKVSSHRKKTNKSDLGVKIMAKPWTNSKVKSCKDCSRMAKRRRTLTEDENKLSESEEDCAESPAVLQEGKIELKGNLRFSKPGQKKIYNEIMVESRSETANVFYTEERKRGWGEEETP